MADRYWVGGTGTWNTTSTTNWSASSGGPSGASVPTVADSVFFDQAGTYTVTATGALNCLDFTVSAGTVTFGAGASPSFNVRGSLSIIAGTSFGAINFTFSSTTTGRTITTNGVVLAGSNFDFNGVGGGWTLGSALTLGGSIYISIANGTFNTGNYSVTAGLILTSASSARTINLGSSTVTLQFGANCFDASTNTNLTFNAGTSTIICSGATTGIIGGPTNGTGLTFHNVSFTSTSAGTSSIGAINTFNNLTVTAPSTAGVRQVTFDSRQTINGTLSITGATAGNRRVWFRSSTLGIAQTLTINSTPSLTDADFRDIYVIGTAAPISGTRIGDLRGILGITASTPKTVYWNLPAGGNWSANAWAASSGGAVSTDNFPLAQDTAVIENTGLNTSATVTMDSAILYAGTVTMSTRTNAMTLNIAAGPTIYGDWTNGSGTTLSGSSILAFSGRNTQTIISAGKTFPGNVTIDTYGGTVQLGDALTSTTLEVVNGTFSTQNFNLTVSSLTSSYNNVRTINLGSSTVSASSGLTLSNITNLTFNAGTSQINVSGSGFSTGGLTFNNVSFTGSSASISGANTFNNLTVTAPVAINIGTVTFAANQTITGTLSSSGSTPVNRIFIRSSTISTTRTLTVGSITVTDCDFRDITLSGTASGSSPTRAGDCGGNTGITFTSKTVYWNLAGSQNWSATGWASSSGGTPDINQFPLAQDTAVFDNTGAAGTVTIDQAWNIGTVNMSARTSAMTFTVNGSALIYGDWTWGTGVTSSSTSNTLTFSSRGTEVITSNGVTFGCPVTIDTITGTVQLADALTINTARTFIFNSGTFDAVSYNVTAGSVAFGAPSGNVFRMGSGTWTLTGTGTVWNFAGSPTLFKGSANIVLSDTSTTSRTFSGGSQVYNKLTIGGTTGTSTTTINGNNTFSELASTKTVAHTIALGSTTQTFGAWTVTGTAGNVVTLTGTGTSHVIAGARVTGIDYLAMGSIGFSSTSPGEFYAGANSTGTAGAPVFRTAAPAPTTRYWRGGTGTWDASTTTNWSTSSGGSGGASVPTSADAVVFDSASNATAYTVTCTATQLRCGTLTISGPASGNVTWAGTAPLACHDSVTLPATGLTRTYTGTLTLTGSSAGRTLTTNGVTLLSQIAINGIGASWSLGSALTIANGLTNPFILFNRGTFSTANYNITSQSLNGSASFYIGGNGEKTINLGSSTISIAHGGGSGTSIIDASTVTANLTFNAGTSQFEFTSGAAGGLNANGLTFNNVTYSGINGDVTNTGSMTFNNLSVTRSGSGLAAFTFSGNQTVNGTLTISSTSPATGRVFVRSNTLGTTRTITAAAVSLTDADFRDITIAGAAAPASGTRLGDCKGNSGITFDTPKTVYWNLAGTQNWNATGWATSSGGTPAVNNFPLAQDTAVFDNAGAAGTITFTVIPYNIGSVDMSSRTTGMTLSTNVSGQPFIYGNWANGSGTTLGGDNTITFAGRGTQTITSAGKTWAQQFVINTPNGSVTLQDNFIASASSGSVFSLTAGTFNANNYNFTLSGSFSAFSSSGSATRTIAIGSGTWTIAGSGGWNTATSTNLTVTGTGTINLTSASTKTFNGGGIAYTNITLNQGGAGALTISGNNTFKNISSTSGSATSINLGSTTQTVSQFTAAGGFGRVLTLNGSSAASPGTLRLTSGTVFVDYVNVNNVRAYPLTSTWTAGGTNGGSLGFTFTTPIPPPPSTGRFFMLFP